MDIVADIKDAFDSLRRPPDSDLHCSSDLNGCLRCCQLRAANAPMSSLETGDHSRLLTGTLWHKWLAREMSGKMAMFEVDFTNHLPFGWSGTADMLLWDEDNGYFRVYDFKTTKAEGMRFITGIKEDHLWQLSAYRYAAQRSGLPVDEMVSAVYIPMGKSYGADITVYTEKAIPVWEVEGRMEGRRFVVDEYLKAFRHHTDFENDLLEPVCDRVQKVRVRQGVKEVYLEPSWRAKVCSFGDLGCCKDMSVTKIGSFKGDVYNARGGYEDVVLNIDNS